MKLSLNKYLLVYQFAQVNYPLMDRLLVLAEIEAFAKTLTLPVGFFNPQQFFETDEGMEAKLYVIDEVAFYLHQIQDPAYLITLIQKIFDWKQASNSYYIFLNSQSIELPEQFFPIIPTLFWPLPTESEIKVILQESLGYEHQTLCTLCSGLSFEELRTGLELLKISDRSQEKQLLEYKQEQLKRMGLDFLPIPSLAEFGGLDLLKKAIHHVKLDYESRATQLNIPLPKGWLLVGPPGTGKTFASKCCAAILNFPLLIIGVDLIKSKGAAYLKELLIRIEASAPVVCYFDEFDKFFDPDAALNGTNKDVLGVLLTWFQEKVSKTFVIATLNRLDALPPELTRAGRFDKIFYVGFPQAIERQEIVKLHASRFDSTYSFGDRLSTQDWQIFLNQTHNYTGAELQAIVTEAARRQYHENPCLDAISLELEDLLVARKQISSLFSRDPERVLAMQNRAKNISEQTSSTDRSIYAPKEVSLWDY